MKVVGLCRNAQNTRSVPAGTAVFHEGDLGHEMYGVIWGEVDLLVGDRVVASLGPDEVFGETEVLVVSPRMATAVAKKHTVLAVIDRDRFLHLVHDMPLFALQVMTTMAERLRSDDYRAHRESFVDIRAV